MANYVLHLNFLPVVGEFPKFTIYRRQRLPSEETNPEEGIYAYDLPIELEEPSERHSYLVSLEDRPTFMPFTVTASTKIDLGRRVLLESLKRKCSAEFKSHEFNLSGGAFLKEIDFCVGRHPEGEERIAIQPFYLATAKEFGFLVDFHFRVNEGVPFSRRVQQLSLSLDENYRRNLDYYTARLEKIRSWIHNFHPRIFPLSILGTRGYTQTCCGNRLPAIGCSATSLQNLFGK